MELRPMNDGLFIVFEIEGDLDVIGHDGWKIDLVDLDDIGDERTTDSQVESALANDDRQPSIGKL